MAQKSLNEEEEKVMRQRFTVIGSGHPVSTFVYMDDKPARNVKRVVFSTGFEGTTVEVVSFKLDQGGQFLKDVLGEILTESTVYTSSDTDFEAKIDPLFPFLSQPTVPDGDQVQHLLHLLRICSEKHMITTDDLAKAMGWNLKPEESSGTVGLATKYAPSAPVHFGQEVCSFRFEEGKKAFDA